MINVFQQVIHTKPVNKCELSTLLMLKQRKYTMDYEFLQEIWIKVLEDFKRDLTPPSYSAFIEPLRIYGFVSDTIILIAPDFNTKRITDVRHLGKLQFFFTRYLKKDIPVKIVLSNDISENGISMTEHNSIIDQNYTNSNIVSKYLFENFVRGRSNELAFAASVAVAEAPGQTKYNPLFLYGGVGLGKTHLMHSIGNFIFNSNPNLKVLYTSTENLMNEFIASIRESKTPEFRDKFRNVDVLLVDDIQFLEGKNETQEEFFHTFNTLYFADKQIVISSDRPPIELKTLQERLTSRFGSGLIVDITLPDFETRTAILEKKAEMEKLNVPKEVVRLIAKSVSSNIRELEGALIRVTAHSKLTNTTITMEMAEQTLKDMVTEYEKRDISVEYIQEVVSNHYNISVEDIVSKKRTANLSFPRQIAMYLTDKLLGSTLKKIGESFGGKDHTTVLYARKAISEKIESDEEFRNIIDEIERKIKG